MKILIKYPSRGRPGAFFEGLDSIVNNAHNLSDILVLGTFDVSDPVMCNRELFDGSKVLPFWGFSESKVHAINRDLQIVNPNTSKKPFLDFDILVVFSDDMRFTAPGFDTILRNAFADGNLDKLIHLPDQDAKDALATMYIAGRTFYERFGYVYHPSYKSLWCDNEIMEVAQRLGKYEYVDYPGVIAHLNPAYGHGPKDEMFLEQQRIGWNEDHKNYMLRKSEWEHLEGEELIKYMQKI